MVTLLFIQTPVIPWIKDIFRPLPNSNRSDVNLGVSETAIN